MATVKYARSIGNLCRCMTTNVCFRRSSHQSVYTIDIPGTSLAEFVQKDFKKYARRTALIDGTSGRKLSFEELEERIARCTVGLLSAGLLPGDVVCLYGVNAPEFVEILLAVTKTGAALTIANSQLTAEELAGQLKITKSKFVICTPDCVQRALRASQSISSKEMKVYVIGEAEGCRSYSNLLNGTQTSRDVKPESSDMALLPFSSGTTGLPKGVVLTHSNLVANLSQIRHESVLPMTADHDVSIAALPMVHIAGLVVGLLNPLAQGATVVTLPRFDLESYLKAIDVYQGTFSLVAPPIINLLAKHPLVDKYNLSSITCLYSGASTLSKDLTVQTAERLQLNNIRQGYGMSETSPVLTTDPVGDFRYGSIGKPIPNTQLKLVCPERNVTVTEPHQTGEVWAHGPQVTKGYLKNDKATAESITQEGWIKTGDEGYFDGEGHYYIVDRIKDIIKYKGYQISPAYLESVLLTHPGVADVAVIGVSCGVMGEVPRAYVVPKHKINAQDLIQYVREKVAPYKHLRGGIEFTDEIPKSPSGKILRRVLQSNYRDSKQSSEIAKE